jgi:transposase
MALLSFRGIDTPTQYERDELGGLLSRGKNPARKLKRAQILLAADAGVSDEDIALSVGVGGSTVYRTKRRFVEGNLERALSEEPRPGAKRKLTGKEEALLVATACSSPPMGRARWTLKLLADVLGADLGLGHSVALDNAHRVQDLLHPRIDVLLDQGRCVIS